MSDEKLIVDGTWNITPKYQSVLKVNTNLHFQFEKPMPNAWHRFWQKFLLGWEWSEAQQNMHLTSGSLRDLWASFWLRASSALKHFTSPPTGR